MILKPQKGPQERFLSTRADICIYGGAAGGGKSYGLLLCPLRYKDVKDFSGAIFRHNYNQIFSPGGLWEEADKMYRGIRGSDASLTRSQWSFSYNGEVMSRLTFAHIERDEDVAKWQGSQICFIGFDELTHFSEKTFFYMLSRNRSTCGVKPFVRATCNPDANSWVAKFIDWWLNDEGYPVPEKSGKLRWFVRRDEEIIWADTPEELWERFELKTEEERQEPRSVTFIMSRLTDNTELMRINPQYMANLKALSVIERERLLMGNWKIKPSAGLYFRREQLPEKDGFLPFAPKDVDRWVRCWDLAATEKTASGDPCYTAGVLMGKRRDGRYVIADVINKQLGAGDVRSLIKQTAELDRQKYGRVRVRLPQDPGQAGKAQAESFVKFLAGFDVRAERETGSKELRAEPLAAQWQAGNVSLVTAGWNESYLMQMENFPDYKFKDMVDASANAFSELEIVNQFSLKGLI
ncbi:MAG: phage terminase large subunit [Clostridia bacterium]|nr:phage terminase large subunit [Clostridia bacterium]